VCKNAEEQLSVVIEVNSEKIYPQNIKKEHKFNNYCVCLYCLITVSSVSSHSKQIDLKPLGKEVRSYFKVLVINGRRRYIPLEDLFDLCSCACILETRQCFMKLELYNMDYWFNCLIYNKGVIAC